MRKDEFLSLNLHQQIAKCAMRVEKLAHAGSAAGEILAELRNYALWLKEENHPRAERASILLSGLVSSPEEQLRREAYFAYLALRRENHENSDDVESFSVRRFDRSEETRRFQIAVVLDNIRAPFNAGNILRSAEAFGASEAALCGITPGPEDPKTARAAMGAESGLKINRFGSVREAIDHYRELGFQIVAMETSHRAVPLSGLKAAFPSALVLGNEELGLSEETLSLCDAVAEIPLYGKKNSLNVSNAAAIAFYEWTKPENPSGHCRNNGKF